jgi:hypothetical protein
MTDVPESRYCSISAPRLFHAGHLPDIRMYDRGAQRRFGCRADGFSPGPGIAAAAGPYSEGQDAV